MLSARTFSVGSRSDNDVHFIGSAHLAGTSNAAFSVGVSHAMSLVSTNRITTSFGVRLAGSVGVMTCGDRGGVAGANSGT